MTEQAYKLACEELAMNIYLLNEDGDTFCIQARSMDVAIEQSLKIYLEEQKEVSNAYDEDEEISYYHREILKSCSLVGELKN